MVTVASVVSTPLSPPGGRKKPPGDRRHVAATGGPWDGGAASGWG